MNKERQKRKGQLVLINLLWRRLLWAPWTARKSNQSILKKINPDAKAEVSIFWPSDAKSQFIGKNPDARKDWGQEEKRVTEEEMVGWHQWFNGHEFEQTLVDSKIEGSWHVVVHGVAKSWIRLSDWKTTAINYKHSFCPCDLKRKLQSTPSHPLIYF